MFEQPERKQVALAALGEVTSLVAHWLRALRHSRRPLARTVCGSRQRSTGGPDRGVAGGPGGAGGGPIAVGGFSFAQDGGSSPPWGGFEPASLVVPEVALARDEHQGERRVRLTLSALAAPDDTPEDLLARLQRRLEELRSRPLALLDPAPAGRCKVASTMAPEHYEGAVARAVELIRRGDLQKIVLAREVQVHAPAAYDPAAVFGVLRAEFPSCFVFCVGPRREHADRRLARAAGTPRGTSREHPRTGGVHEAQRRPLRRRPPRRAAAALGEGPRRAGDRDPPHRAHA